MSKGSGQDPASNSQPESRRRDSANGTEVRKLAAIIFTDMVGFSQLMHENEERGLRLLDESNKIISEAVTQHRGRVLKRMGDAVLAEFSSATSAVECAVQIQTELRDYNEGKPHSAQIALRIGIHLGDVVIRDQDLFGDGVNVAARLEPLAEPGGICLSEAVYQAIRASSSVAPIRVGEVELKNILHRQVIYRIPSFYATTKPETADAAVKRRSLDLGAVDRVETLPPPRRGFVSMLWMAAVSLPLILFAGLLSGMLLGVVFGRDAYQIWDWELVEPADLVTALQERTDPAHAYIWESLDRDTREAISIFEASQTRDLTAARTFRRLRRSLNDLIWAGRPILADTVAPDLNGRSPASPAEMAQFNRALLEAVFPGSIQRYVGEPPIVRVFERKLAHLWSNQWFLMALVFGMPLSVVAQAYSMSLKSLRIYFNDIRDVDALLDYYLRDLGFRAPVREVDGLVFRATLWTWLLYMVVQVQARVSGSTVVLTGPAPMMRRLAKRMQLFAMKL